MKSFLRLFLPGSLFELRRRFGRFLDSLYNRTKSVEEVFTDIYARGKWGGAVGEWISGAGSVRQHIVDSYIAAICDLASREGFRDHAFVDLGCGDFSVGKQLLPLCSSYVGVDIVRPLIARNQELFGGPSTSFAHLDVIKDVLPDGDVCFVRQVLQHLSNRHISTILSKLKKYRWVIITEHYPEGFYSSNPNIDKVHGADIRFYSGSGVYLDEPPFCIPGDLLSLVLEVPVGSSKGSGILRTYLYKPN